MRDCVTGLRECAIGLRECATDAREPAGTPPPPVVHAVQVGDRMKLLWIALTLAACGKSPNGTAGSNAPSPASSPASAPGGAAATGPEDRCEVHVTGPQTADIVGTRPRSRPDGKVMAASEYWMSDEELRMALGTFVRLGGDKPSKAEIEHQIDEAMKKDPRLWLLMLNCSTDDGFLHLGASNGSKSSDIPFGPHTYAIANEPKAGEISVMFSTKRGKSTSYHLAAPGKLEITKFDATGITGTFGFEADTNDKSRVTVKGSFDYGCTGRKCK
jgi:hypothetical protein